MRNIHRFNFPAFHEAARLLRNKGWDIVSPAELDEDLGFDPDRSLEDNGFELSEAMKRDLEALMTCDTIILLPGWRNSKGACLELDVARAVGLSVFEYHVGSLTDITDESICAEADRIVDGARQQAYGPPSQDFARTGRLWGGVLGLPDISPEKVALMMICLKVSRLVQTPDHKDSIVDTAGYAKTLDLIRRAK